MTTENGSHEPDVDSRTVDELAQYETLIERTAPPAGAFRCRCDRCAHGPHYRPAA